MKKIICFFIAISCLLFSITAQEALKSIEEEYYDFLSLQGLADRPSLGYRTLSDSVWIIDDDADHVWKDNSLDSTILLFDVENPASNLFMDGIEQSLSIRLYGPRLYTSYNNDFPFGQNDGALWQGAGFNSSLSAGVRLEGFGFEATFKPQITYSQNKDWDYLTGITNPYGYFSWQLIDIVQRYGDEPFYTYSWGDSEIRWTWNTLTVGYGTQSPWIGPAWLNPMLGSNNADPYPKLDVGLRKTPIIIPGLNWNLGELEVRIWLGRLTQSKYFSGHKDTDRMINMASFSYSPSFIDGFTVGLNRLFMTYWQKENLSYMLRLFNFKHKNGTGSGNDEDQKAALFADWMFPESGFEVYGEIGIDDFTCYEIANPFHTGIYTIGVKQYIPIFKSIEGLLNLEWNGFEMSQDFQLQWQYGGYYYHSFVNQGYTNNGQIVGAGSGALGNCQTVSFTIFYPKGKTVVKGQRNSPNVNYILNKAVNSTADDLFDTWYAMYETYFSGGLETTYFLTSSFSLSAEANAIFRYFPKYAGLEWDYETSLNLCLGCKYTF
ncbi:MAG: hypothetical protein KBT02_02670 [Treponema sp.]|nr:hypothetical protein [Candidatus Treponema caballi]